MDKTQLRTTLKKQRQDIDIVQFDANSLLTSQITAILRRASIVAGYVPMRGEIDPALMLVKAAEFGAATALPVIDGREAPLRFVAWSQGEPLARAAWGFMQPVYTATSCTPDVILTPLVGFDHACNRLGQGQGHYDRAFARFPHALRIGVAWSVQEVEQIPLDPWDIALDAVITEKEWIAAPNGRISVAPPQ
jgi:5-formyltetrahydrofolate cyclo-ligase